MPMRIVDRVMCAPPGVFANLLSRQFVCVNGAAGAPPPSSTLVAPPRLQFPPRFWLLFHTHIVKPFTRSDPFG